MVECLTWISRDLRKNWDCDNLGGYTVDDINAIIKDYYMQKINPKGA